MADIRAFRAYRYDLGRVGTLADVIAPPYDVIDPALQDALYNRSPYNVIRPIFGLFPDEEGAVQSALDKAVGRSLPREATDHLGVVSRLWPVSDQHTLSAVTGLMGPRPIFIADGHHRYETALQYLEERREA